jgi:hypothetical protein
MALARYAFHYQTAALLAYYDMEQCMGSDEYSSYQAGGLDGCTPVRVELRLGAGLF